MSTILKLQFKVFVISFLVSLCSVTYAQKIGVQTTIPDSTFSVKNKVEIGGTHGDIIFTDDKASITFPPTYANNAPMIQMFADGTANEPRMIFAHSPAFNDWGLQYRDLDDQFHFMSNGSEVFSLDLLSGRTSIGKLATLEDIYTLNVQTNTERTVGYFYNDNPTTLSTFGIYGGANGLGSGNKTGGFFEASGGSGENIGMEARASGGSSTIAIKGIAQGSDNYAGYFLGRGFFSENVGIGEEPINSRELNITANGNSTVGSYVRNEYSGGLPKFGYYSTVNSQGTGARYGYYAGVTANSSDLSPSYGVRSIVSSNNSSGFVYGMYSSISGQGTGNKYGIYSTVATQSNTWAGYFSGKMQIVNGQEASLTQDGFLQLGFSTSSNIVIDNNEIAARNNSAEAPLYLQPNQGPVSIGGGTATGYLLSVDGDIIGEDLTIQNSGSWPDYVFEKEYNLPSIEAYEASIKTNKHLPGIPSAKELEENGIRVGEMLNKQMEKIEELALYVIQLNKRVHELEKENGKLRLENEKTNAQ